MAQAETVEVATAPGTTAKRKRFSKYPRELHIGVTDWCNLKCFICMREEYEENIGGPGVFMPMEQIQKLESAIREAEIVNLTGFGETFLHPDFDEIIDYILSVNPRPNLIKVITNGTALTKRRAETLKGRIATLIISLNAARREDYEREMGSKWDLIMKRLNEFTSVLEESDLRRIELHHVTHAFNYQRMCEFVQLCHDLGLYQVNFNPFMVQRPKNISYSLMYVREEYNIELAKARMLGRQLDVTVIGRKFFEEKRATGPMEDLCVWPFEQAQIGTYGEFMPCCFSGHEHMGNVFEKEFEDIWFSDQYEKLRDVRYLKSCQNCAQLTIFDDYNTHFHPQLKLNPEWDEVQAELEEMEDLLVKRLALFNEHALDSELYFYAAEILGEGYKAQLASISGVERETSGAQPSSIKEIDVVFEEAFLASPLTTPRSARIEAGDLFLGTGWSRARPHADFGMRSRPIGNKGSGSIYLALQPDASYMLRTDVWYGTTLETLQNLTVEANGVPLDCTFAEENNLLQIRCLLSSDLFSDSSGRLKITFHVTPELSPTAHHFDDQGGGFEFVRIHCDPIQLVAAADGTTTVRMLAANEEAVSELAAH